MTFSKWLVRLFAVVALAGLMACAASGPKPTVIKASVDVQPTVNPDSRGRASPVVARVYALKSPAAFNGADFFSLFEKDKETLGAEMLDKEELQLMPGQKRDLQKPFPPETRYVGVIAAFRDLERSQWRAVIAVPPQKSTVLQIVVEKNAVSIAVGK
ncbi:MAG TPA: type VI secretion system lipoprotein TssJ [Burkholderiales bacterium]|jgi:type VI secretion system protein VasD|nr:type VI secretion system lipoprotein TssJ [Burkholderiales bacterium]